MGTSYDRELRSELACELKGVRAVTRSCSELERAMAMRVVNRPFLVVRAPGSGTEGTGDLLVLRGDLCFQVEVKSSIEVSLNLNDKNINKSLVSVKRFNSNELNPLADEEMLDFIRNQAIDDLVNQLFLEVSLIDM